MTERISDERLAELLDCDVEEWLLTGDVERDRIERERREAARAERKRQIDAERAVMAARERSARPSGRSRGRAFNHALAMALIGSAAILAEKDSDR